MFPLSQLPGCLLLDISSFTRDTPSFTRFISSFQVSCLRDPSVKSRWVLCLELCFVLLSTPVFVWLSIALVNTSILCYVECSGFKISSGCLSCKFQLQWHCLDRYKFEGYLEVGTCHMGNGPNPMFNATFTLTIYGSNINRPI